MLFTYDEVINKNCLFQGDVLKRTKALENVLKDVHPYYKEADYPFFAIITQSCGLEKRQEKDDKCDSRYITLAAMRSTKLAVKRQIELYQSAIEREIGVCNEKYKQKLKQFLERLLNNNERDYFYFHSEGELETSYCAFLQLTISIKSDLHYKTLLDAKTLQLKGSFQNKLGYLVGILYSRVGTEDWQKEELKREIQCQIDGVKDDVTWSTKDTHDKVIKKMEKQSKESHNLKTFGEIQEDMGKNETRGARIEKAIDMFSEELRLLEIDGSAIRTMSNRLKNKNDFCSLFR